MDPAIATYRTSRLVTEQLYSTLMALGPDGRPYPDLAAWIEVSDDALTYTFGLVDGVRFHDGSPLTADDVAFTFQRLLDMGEAYHFDPWVATIAGADVVDAHDGPHPSQPADRTDPHVARLLRDRDRSARGDRERA